VVFNALDGCDGIRVELSRSPVFVSHAILPIEDVFVHHPAEEIASRVRVARRPDSLSQEPPENYNDSLVALVLVINVVFLNEFHNSASSASEKSQSHQRVPSGTN
jgi:hypothetical protein